MIVCLRPFVFAAFLAAVAAGGARADDSGPFAGDCKGKASIARFENGGLIHVAARVAQKETITIVAFGSSSTEGIGASNTRATYPARLEAELGHTVKLFCYPNGDYDARVRRAVEEAGYACAVTVESGLNDSLSDILALKRVHTEQDLARFAQSTSGFEQVKNRFRYVYAKTASF